MSTPQYDNPSIMNFDTGTALHMFDKLTRIGEGRRVMPFDQVDNVLYAHRGYYSNYNLQIGDTCFMIPPEFIMVTSEATTQSIITLRQENSVRERSGFHKRLILIDLVFNGLDQINGYKVSGPESPEKYYYVDGLRQLLAQFKCTPFLPIANELVNGVYGIFTVVLQSITMSTVPGFPNLMNAQITLQEVDMFPYIEMPNVCFERMIDWDLFRFYYQSFLTETNEYRKLQSLHPNKEHNRFRISLLDEAVFNSEQATQYNLLELICDKKIVDKEKGTNYTLWLDSNESDVVISSFQCGYSNILTNIQLTDCSCPTVQFMGGMDTIYNIQFETTDYSVVQALEACRIANDTITRENAKLHSLGFVKLESELVAFTGSLFVMIESVSTNTVPGFPNLYNVQINCVAYDIAQSSREELHGFRPFECDNKECLNNDFEPEHLHATPTRTLADFSSFSGAESDETIEQSMNGLKTKIRQDNYAEWMIRSEIEVYPDLRLPTYAEVNEFITKCNEFRETNGLEKLPYTEYPVRPVCMLHGSNPNNTITLPESGTGVIDANDISTEGLEYNVFIDPDFYVFYPWSYKSFEAEEGIEGKWYDSYKGITRDTVTKTMVVENSPIVQTETDMHTDGAVSNGNLIEEFISTLEAQIGCSYLMEPDCDGRRKDSSGRFIFDCSGLITYALRQIGVMATDRTRLTVAQIVKGNYNDLFREVSWSEKKRGDLLTKYNNTDHHVVVYKGDEKIIHASSRKGVTDGTNYFKNTSDVKVFRVRAFETTVSTVNGVIEVAGTGATAVWSTLKSYGLSDIACAGIMGNMMAESNINPYNVQGSYKQDNQDEYNKNYVSKVDSGEISRYDFVNNGPGGGGFGLVQFTYSGYKEELYDLAKANGKSIADIGIQVAVFINQIKSSGVYDKLNASTSVKDASNIMLLEYERPANQGVSVQNKRANNSQTIYQQFAGTNTVNNNISISGPTLTMSEFDSICRTIMAEIEGINNIEVVQAIAQVIYDKLTSDKYGGLGTILNDQKQFHGISTENIIPEEIKTTVKGVFCEGKKRWSDYCAYAFISNENDSLSYNINDKEYSIRLGDISVFTFWGEDKSSSDIKYTLTNAVGTGSASGNTKSFFTDVTYEAKEAQLKHFAEPVLIKTDAMIYDDSWKFWTGIGRKENARKNLNATERIFGSSFVNEAQYSCRGRLVKAFPTYLFCLLDDQNQWYDGRKLWTNYYVTKSVVDIAVHETNDMPTATATITVSNLYRNLSRTQGGLHSLYSLKNDIVWWQKAIYGATGLVVDFGSPNLTKKMIQLHQIIYNNVKLREGARVHLRMGYGSDPLSLAPMINGTISDITVGDQINMVVTSDGVELTQHVTSSSEKDTNNGILGLFGFAEEQEPSNIIAHIMCKRQNWFSHVVGSWFEGSKYSIEHFGLYFNQTVMRYLASIPGNIVNAVGDAFSGPYDAIGGDSTVSQIIGGVAGGVWATGTSPLSVLSGLASSATSLIADLWNEYQEQYDIMKNVYKSDYGREHYIYSDFLGLDGEKNVVFNKYNMTPWDVFQVCAQTSPEYIVKPTYHQFDSRLYFGLPFWMEKYRYDYLNKIVYEECKSSSQMHIVDSLTNIIDNQIRVTNRYSNTNVKVMYTRGDSATSTQTLHSDDTIDYAKQKTGIIDSSITQDAFGPDAVWEFFGYRVGYESARRLGISNLLYGWQQQYQGQIICLGMPGVRAHDYFMLYDTYVNMYGLALVREVVHSFGINTGFTTSITPGMIGFSTDNQSGMVEVCKNYLSLLNHFSSFLYTRHVMKNNYEKNLNLFSNMKMAEEQVKSLLHQSIFESGMAGTLGFVVPNTFFGGAALGYFGGLTGMKKAFLETVKYIFSKKGIGELAGTFYKAYKEAMVINKAMDGIKMAKAVRYITTFFNAVSKGTLSTITAVIPGGVLIGAAMWLIVNVVVREVIEWWKNRNVCCLLPLWWENSTFVSGVSGGTKILLCNAASTPTDEEEEALANDGGTLIPSDENPSEDNDGY